MDVKHTNRVLGIAWPSIKANTGERDDRSNQIGVVVRHAVTHESTIG